MNEFLTTVMLTMLTFVVVACGVSSLIFLYALTQEFIRDHFMGGK
jgi:hypothetical protein